MVKACFWLAQSVCCILHAVWSVSIRGSFRRSVNYVRRTNCTRFRTRENFMVTATPAETTLRRVSLADAAYDVLQQAILRGELPPGEELSAVALAERYRVSRTPITEALQRLTHDGLVLQEPHRQPRVVKLERSDVVEIYEMRPTRSGRRRTGRVAHHAGCLRSAGRAARRALRRAEAEQLGRARHRVRPTIPRCRRGSLGQRSTARRHCSLPSLGPLLLPTDRQ